ncbi:hypothetical protein AC1031_007931 [Aphanomyces cochlioides]|nr:hypothetical protein AC1031_007931 [Aphanomyces cochlioides]
MHLSLEIESSLQFSIQREDMASIDGFDQRGHNYPSVRFASFPQDSFDVSLAYTPDGVPLTIIMASRSSKTIWTFQTNSLSGSRVTFNSKELSPSKVVNALVTWMQEGEKLPRLNVKMDLKPASYSILRLLLEIDDAETNEKAIYAFEMVPRAISVGVKATITPSPEEKTRSKPFRLTLVSHCPMLKQFAKWKVDSSLGGHLFELSEDGTSIKALKAGKYHVQFSARWNPVSEWEAHFNLYVNSAKKATFKRWAIQIVMEDEVRLPLEKNDVLRLLCCREVNPSLLKMTIEEI